MSIGELKMETETNEVVNPKARQEFHVVNVVETFETKRAIESHLMENDLGEGQVIVKGKLVETRPSVAII